MCQEVEVRTPTGSAMCGSVRELAAFFSVLVEHRDARLGDATPPSVDREATHCLCPIDVSASATASGYRVVDDRGFCPEFIVEKI